MYAGLDPARLARQDKTRTGSGFNVCGKEGPSVAGVPVLRSRDDLKQSSAWMAILQNPRAQGLLQAVNHRRQHLLADEQYQQAPVAIDRVMAYALAIVDRPDHLDD